DVYKRQDMFSPNEPVLAAAHQLRGRIPRVVLSNTNAIHMQYIFARFPMIRGFDGYVLSHELGVEKPDRRIFEGTVRRYRLNARRTVFVDDVAEYVAGARAVGLHAVHHTDAQQTLAELTKLGVPLIETASSQPTPR
ncbi:MAG: HAD-IA family hydrolase, partial [Verrucomicrobiae bacterium]|nr:HAD-IA family hydrolase [Verrucomicrobiae bacterium]